MDNRSGDADRKDAVHSVPQSVARGALQVLRGPVRGFALGVPEPSKEGERGSGSSNGNQQGLDLTDRCEWCNEPLPEGSTIRRMYCSQKCRNRASNAEIAADRLAARAGRVCPQCGGPVPDSKRADAVHCSKKCGKLSNDQWHTSKRCRTCPYCQKDFKAKSRSQVYCSVMCGLKKQPRLPTPCEYCGKPVLKRIGQRFCDKVCSTSARWKAGSMILPPRAFRGRGAFRKSGEQNACK